MTLKALILNRFSSPEQSHVTVERAARSEYVCLRHPYVFNIILRKRTASRDREKEIEKAYVPRLFASHDGLGRDM